jgi:glycosyltransferase involved in cell wall biosynthesis
MLVKIFRLLRVRNLKILTISKALRDSDFFTLPKDLLFYYHDCASDREINNDKLPPFDAKIIKNSPREKVAVYTGALHKGLDFDSLKPLFGRYKNWTFLIYGGKDEAEINEYRHRYAKFDNVTFLGRRTKGEILAIQESADVLLYPLTVSNKLYRYTSPLKLFEYMNSGRPIIASRIGSITEILNEENAYCYTDDILSAAARFEAATDAEKYKKSELNKSLILNKYNWLKRVKYISENCFN